MAGLDLPTEKKKMKNTQKPPTQKKKKKATTTTQRVRAKGRRAVVHWVGEMSVDGSPPSPNSWEREGDALSLSPLFSEI